MVAKAGFANCSSGNAAVSADADVNVSASDFVADYYIKVVVMGTD